MLSLPIRPCDGCQRPCNQHSELKPISCRNCKIPTYFSAQCFAGGKSHQFLCGRATALAKAPISDRIDFILGVLPESKNTLDARAFAVSAYYYFGVKYPCKQAYCDLRSGLNPFDKDEQRCVHMRALFFKYIGCYKEFTGEAEAFFPFLLDNIEKAVGVSRRVILLHLAIWLGENQAQLDKSWEEGFLSLFDSGADRNFFKEKIDKAFENKKFRTVLDVPKK